MHTTLRSRLALLLLSVLLPGILATAWVIAQTYRAEYQTAGPAPSNAARSQPPFVDGEPIRQVAPRSDALPSAFERRPAPAHWSESATLRVALGSMALLASALGGVWWAATRRIAGPAEPAAGAHSDRSAASLHGDALASDASRVEALGRLTGGVVHDFNNLLGVVSNSAHLIQRQAPGPELQAPVAATLRAVEAGSRLTQHLMRFAGRQPSPPHAVDLASTLADADEFLRSIAGRRIEVSVAVAPATRRVMVDAGGLELALTTLALNARDAMPSGGRLRLHACNADADDTTGLADGDYVLITVGDEGQGEGDAAPSAPSLRQVHSFCVRSGGTSRSASTPGLGTTVSMLLPAC